MLLLTIEVTDQNAMKALYSLEEKQLIKIADDVNLNSPSLPGAPLSLKAFKNWVKDAEAVPTISLKQASAKWAHKRRQLQKISR